MDAPGCVYICARHNLTKIVTNSHIYRLLNTISNQKIMMKYLTILILFVIINFNLNAQNPSQFVTNNQGNITYVIKNVNIIPMTVSNKVIEDATVVIYNKKIQSINDSIPVNAKTIDGAGKWLIPGLMDMHVHTYGNVNFKGNKPTQGANFFLDTQNVMTSYIANGITTTFDLDAKVEHFGQRNEIASGKVIGPRMALAAMIDGGEGDGRKVNNPNDGRQAVRSAKAEGYNFIKVYSFLDVETFKAIVDESNKQGLKVVGHIPDAFSSNLEAVFVPHFDMVAHAEEYGKQSENKTKKDAEYFAKLAKANNTWLTSSLTTMIWIGNQLRSVDSVSNNKNLKYINPLLVERWINPTTNYYYKRTSPEFIANVDTFIDFQKKLINAFNDAEVPIVAGTDSGIAGVLAGFALHDELELMVEAGMTNEETLISATRLPAEWLGIDKEVGTVEMGKYADLILLDGNPLEDIKNTRSISGVFVNGTWLDKKKIESLLLKLEQQNKSDKGKFKWENRRNY